MTDEAYYSRDEIAQWIDEEGGLDDFLTGHGIELSELDPEDNKLVNTWETTMKAHAKWSAAKANLEKLLEY